MPLILPSNSISAVGYEVDNSLRFDDGFSDRLIKTFSTSGNQRTVTFSTWFKISALGTIRHLFSNSGADSINLASNDTLEIQLGGSAEGYLYLNRVFRDPSAWYHIVFNMDTTQSTASNRLKVYINGIQETSFSATSYPTQNLQTGFSENVQHSIGSRSANNDRFFDGYMTETVFIDGQQLDPTSFGEFDEDTGIWKPIDVSGLTFGTNGFYLDFENSGSLGADVSGNGNNFTVNNLTSIDQTTDTPTNNFCTLNPLVTATVFTDNQTYSEGNTIIIPNSTDQIGTTFSTIGVQGSGKWYWEAQVVWNGTSNNANFPKTIGFCTENYAFNYSYLGQDQESWGMMFSDDSPDQWFASHPDENNNEGGTMANGDIVNLALDLDNGYFYFGVNGTYLNSGDPTSGASGTGAVFTLTATDLSKFIIPAITNSSVTTTYYKLNFGNPAFTISSGNSDGAGFGQFEYAPPSGYLALCTKNLATDG
jgi:hypothetical protein